MSWAQPEPALRYARQALAYAEQHEVHNLASYIAVTLAWLRLRAGEWDEAERVTRSELEKSMSVAQLLAKTVLAELAVRRGDEDASERLADLSAQADRASEPQRIAPLLELETEWALTTGAPMPIERLEALLDDDAAARLAGRLGRHPRRRMGGRRRARGRARRRRTRRRTPRCCGATGTAQRTHSARSAGRTTAA